MKTIYKIALYTMAGAALVSGALGCGKKESALEQSLSASKIEAPSERYSPAPQETNKKLWFVGINDLEDAAKSIPKFSEDLRDVKNEFQDLAEFEKVFWKELAKTDEELRLLRDSYKGD